MRFSQGVGLGSSDGDGSGAKLLDLRIDLDGLHWFEGRRLLKSGLDVLVEFVNAGGFIKLVKGEKLTRLERLSE